MAAFAYVDHCFCKAYIQLGHIIGAACSNCL